jgi:hypothetical protein
MFDGKRDASPETLNPLYKDLAKLFSEAPGVTTPASEIRPERLTPAPSNHSYCPAGSEASSEVRSSVAEDPTSGYLADGYSPIIPATVSPALMMPGESLEESRAKKEPEATQPLLKVAEHAGVGIDGFGSVPETPPMECPSTIAEARTEERETAIISFETTQFESPSITQVSATSPAVFLVEFGVVLTEVEVDVDVCVEFDDA